MTRPVSSWVGVAIVCVGVTTAASPAAEPEGSGTKEESVNQREGESQADGLRKIPVSVMVQERELSMTGSVIRNLMPTIGPRGPSTYLVLRIKAAGAGGMPEGLACAAVHGVSGKDVWTQADLEVREARGGMEVVARRAPEWEQAIDVVVVLQDAQGRQHRLRAPGVEVMEVH